MFNRRERNPSAISDSTMSAWRRSRRRFATARFSAFLPIHRLKSTKLCGATVRMRAMRPVTETTKCSLSRSVVEEGDVVHGRIKTENAFHTANSRNLVIVVFELVAHRRHDHVAAAEDLEEGHVAGVTERDDQLAQERAVPRLPARKGGCRQRREAGTHGRECLLGDVEIPTVSLQLTVQDEVEQAIEVSLGLAGQADPKAHPRVAGLRARAASSLR